LSVSIQLKNIIKYYIKSYDGSLFILEFHENKVGKLLYDFIGLNIESNKN